MIYELCNTCKKWIDTYHLRIIALNYNELNGSYDAIKFCNTCYESVLDKIQVAGSKREDICCCKKCDCPNISNHLDNCVAHR